MDANKMQTIIENVDQIIKEDNSITDNSNVSTDNMDIKTDNLTDSNTDIPTDNIDNNNSKSYSPNLIPFNERTEDEQRRIASLGGKKSGENRRKRKQAAQLLADILGRTLNNEQIDEILGDASSLLGDDKSAYNVMLVKMLQCAMAGDVKAATMVRDTVGDKPIEEIKQTTITQEDIKAIEDVKKRLMG